MRPFRQVKAWELMIAASNYSLSHTQAILAGTGNAEED
jgi:hypothetical protein